MTLELRPAHKLFGDLNLLEGSFDYHPITLRLSNANQKLFDYRPITPRYSNSSQNYKRNNNPFLEPEKEYVPLYLLRDRCKVGVARIARGRFEIMYPAEAETIMSSQRRYQISPPPKPPTIQILLKQAYEYQKLLQENPEMTRTELAKRVGLDPSVISRILNLLDLAPEIQRCILQLESSIYQSPISERRIGQIARCADHDLQKKEFEFLQALKPRARLKLQPPEFETGAAIADS